MSIIRIGIFDDHPIVTDGISTFLAKFPNTIEITFSSYNRKDLITQLTEKELDILIMDIVAPDVNGLELFNEVINDFFSVKIIAYTSLKSPILIENLLSLLTNVI